MPGGLDLTMATSLPEVRESKVEERPGGSGNGGGDIPSDLDPARRCSPRKMPKTKAWPLPNRAKWLRALAMNISFVYEADSQEAGEIEVSIKADAPRAVVIDPAISLGAMPVATTSAS